MASGNSYKHAPLLLSWIPKFTETTGHQNQESPTSNDFLFPYKHKQLVKRLLQEVPLKTTKQCNVTLPQKKVGEGNERKRSLKYLSGPSHKMFVQPLLDCRDAKMYLYLDLEGYRVHEQIGKNSKFYCMCTYFFNKIKSNQYLPSTRRTKK